MTSRDLETIALALIADGKRSVAADETVPTLARRFEALGTQVDRRKQTSLSGDAVCPS
jgi:fructose-bisphosphate aldolase class 1